MVGKESPDLGEDVQGKGRWLQMKDPQKSLKKWTEQNWRTSDGTPSEGKKRYLPDKAWKDLTPAERDATNRAKANGNKQGKQFVPQPKNIAKKVAKHRK